jgi:hypothetical protein
VPFRAIPVIEEVAAPVQERALETWMRLSLAQTTPEEFINNIDDSM